MMRKLAKAKVLRFRVSDEDWQLAEQLAAELGCTRSELFRRLMHAVRKANRPQVFLDVSRVNNV